MSDIIGFARAQAQWENATPYDNECLECEDDLFYCYDCSHVMDKCEPCRECGGNEVLMMDDDQKHQMHLERDEPDPDAWRE